MITNYLSINSDREENLIRIFPDFPVSVYRTRLFRSVLSACELALA